MKRLLQPDLMVEHLFDVPLELLKEKEIRGIIFDLDNTIISWNSKEMTLDIVQWLSELKVQGFQLYIVSNSLKSRVRKIAERLEVPYTGRAGKPLNGGFNAALKTFGLDASKVAVIGDQLFTDVFGGNRIGAFTILVKPLSRNEFFTTKLTRFLEEFIIKKNE